MRELVIGVNGALGSIYGIKLLRDAVDVKTHLVLRTGGAKTALLDLLRVDDKLYRCWRCGED